MEYVRLRDEDNPRLRQIVVIRAGRELVPVHRAEVVPRPLCPSARFGPLNFDVVELPRPVLRQHVHPDAVAHQVGQFVLYLHLAHRNVVPPEYYAHYILYARCVAPQDFLAARRDAVKVEGLDWAGICFAISNSCARFRHPEDAWMTIAATKLKYKLTEDQMLEAFRRCIEGLGDTLNETMACERIVHCMSGDCGTNALPYVEYLIENDARDGVVACAYLELIKMEPNMDRKLLYAEKVLDLKSGHGDCSRIVVYQELRKLWNQTNKDAENSDKSKLASFFERRRLLDKDFKYLAPLSFASSTILSF